jgi:LysM repeat protein
LRNFLHCLQQLRTHHLVYIVIYSSARLFSIAITSDQDLALEMMSSYTVQPGDSMYAISQRLGVTLQALEAANPQVRPPAFQINVGDVLKIPGKGPGPTPSGGTYTVQPGDSMYIISQKLGITLQALEALNPQVKPPAFLLNIGDVLKIPGGKSPGTGSAPGGATTSGGTYTVQPGDSMWAISQKLGITLQALEALNPQVKPPAFQINVGDVLKIPGKGPGPTPPGGTYTVQPGDSMWAISQRLGMSLQALEALNPQVRPPAFQINVGDVLQIS